MAKPMSREELTELLADINEEHDPTPLHQAIERLVKSHRSLWTATDALARFVNMPKGGKTSGRQSQ
jgi:hypothetical protein